MTPVACAQEVRLLPFFFFFFFLEIPLVLAITYRFLGNEGTDGGRHINASICRYVNTVWITLARLVPLTGWDLLGESKELVDYHVDMLGRVCNQLILTFTWPGRYCA